VSVVIVVKVSDGLVLAADSASTLFGRFETPEGVQEGIIKTYYNARKLFQIGDFPIGALTWGQAFIGARTIESLVREWEHDRHWQSRADRTVSVAECAQGLLERLVQIHADEYGNLPEEQRPKLGVIVAGYSEREFFPELWRFIVPLDKEIRNLRPDVDGKPTFGANWYGATDSIVRLHWGRDDAVAGIVSEKFGISSEAVNEALKPLQYKVPFAQMPLQDAIEYANYMLNVVIGRYRFVVGPEICGGEIDIAAITQREFNWIRRKTWKLE